jgi:hypothetical protein
MRSGVAGLKNEEVNDLIAVSASLFVNWSDWEGADLRDNAHQEDAGYV